jgi:hypothetical protein
LSMRENMDEFKDCLKNIASNENLK